MARLIRSERTGPVKIEPGSIPPDRPIWICGCGLTRNFPFCDGSHKQCAGEEPGKTYRYDESGKRVEVTDAV